MGCEEWPIIWPCDAPAESTDEQMDAALSGAQLLLWARTGRRLGICEVTEQYRPRGGGTCGVPWMDDDRIWHNNGGRGACCAIHLVSLPAHAILEVKVHGEVIDPSSYRLERGRLVRYGSCWPAALECDEPPVEVTYEWGVPIHGPIPAEGEDPAVAAAPLWGLVAAAMGEVANELLVSMCGQECKLPSRAVTVSRAGVTVEMIDPASTVELMLLGTPLADALITTVNPGKLQQRSRVYSPDMAQIAR